MKWPRERLERSVLALVLIAGACGSPGEPRPPGSDGPGAARVAKPGGSDPDGPAVPGAADPGAQHPLDMLEKSAGLDSPLKRKIAAWDAAIERGLAVQAAARRQGRAALEALGATFARKRAAGRADVVDLYLEGRRLGKLDRLEEARARFREALARDPEFLYGYEGLAKCAQLADGRLDLGQVERLVDRALRIWGVFPRGWLVLGQALNHHGRFQEAIATFERIPVDCACCPEAAVGIARCCQRMKRPDRAVATLERALERHPDHLGLRAQLGVAWLDAGRLAPARKAFRRVLARDPRQPEARLGMGWVKAREGDVAGAIALFDRLRRDRDLPRVYRRAAVRSLERLQRAARPSATGAELLRRLEESPDAARRREAASVLARVPSPAVLRAFGRKLDVASEPDEGVRVFAVKAVGRNVRPEDLPRLLEPLLDPAREPSGLVRGAAARELGHVPIDRAPLAALIKTLDDGEDYVCRQALRALQEITGRRFQVDIHGALSPREKAAAIAAWRSWYARWSARRAGRKG